MTTEQRPTALRPGTATMRAVVQDVYGDTGDVLRLGGDRPARGRAPGEVLVRVAAAGIDRGVWHLMAGKPYAARLAFGLRTPSNPVRGRGVRRSGRGGRRGRHRRAARRRGVRHRRGDLRRVRGREGEEGRAPAGGPDGRPGRRPADLGDDGAAGGARPRPGVGGAEGAGHRRVRRGRQLRRPDREGVRRRGHRREQRGQGGPGPRPRRRRRRRLRRRATARGRRHRASTSSSTSVGTARCGSSGRSWRRTAGW